MMSLMHFYDHKRVEKKWQRIWSQQKLYEAKDRPPRPDSQTNRGHPSLEKEGMKRGAKFYALIEFPYPSGEGLHVGHPRPYIGMDIIARKRRMESYNVLYPIGWDAFGLPTENYAIKTGIHPAVVTKRNAKNFKRQIQELGISFDWSREINTTDPKYYRWTQWIFLQFFKHGLAYKKKMPINWCLSCKIGLANEEVVDGKCERCGGQTEKREKEQWMLAITKYADRLDKDLDLVDYLPRIKTQQRNWIGRSEGAEIRFKIYDLRFKNEKKELAEITVFTTRPDTLFGATYLVLSPEHPFFINHKSYLINHLEVGQYIADTRKKTEVERTAADREKTGVELKGVKAINPANGEEIPVWIADYVLAEYGTGAIMAVPAHDERDFIFAEKYALPIREVIKPPPPITPPSAPLLNPYPSQTRYSPLEKREREGRRKAGAFTGEGVLISSGKFNGLASEEARKEITEFVGGKTVTTYKLRDWVFSRQRYWGEPIPLIFCENCRKLAESTKSQAPNPKQIQNPNLLNAKRYPPAGGLNAGELLNPGWIAVPDDKLPVKLPTVANYKPTETGESPLAAIASWVNVKCPKCKSPARRETDTMPNWAGSSWYYLRYLDPKNSRHFVGRRKLSYWCGSSLLNAKRYTLNAFPSAGPVDWYNGGMEHTTLHLLYSRFWHKFLYDLKLVPTPEPYAKRTSHGLILAENGEKMSKSKGNVVNPDDIVARFGADSLRVYEMFMGPFEQAISWSTDSLVGARRFLEKVWRLRERVSSLRIKDKGLRIEPLLHQTIKKVTEDIEAMRFNTAVSALMILVNALEKEAAISKGDFEALLKLLAPFAPHLAEELWEQLGHKRSIHAEPWPTYDAHVAESASVTIVVQVNGKVRGSFSATRGSSCEELQSRALKLPEAVKWTADARVAKVIVVPDRLVNVVLQAE